MFQFIREIFIGPKEFLFIEQLVSKLIAHQMLQASSVALRQHIYWFQTGKIFHGIGHICQSFGCEEEINGHEQVHNNLVTVVKIVYVSKVIECYLPVISCKRQLAFSI